MAEVISIHDGGDGKWGVKSVIGGSGDFQKHPCPRCPWRKDAPIGAFPAEAFRFSARTTYDLANTVFGCHASKSDTPMTCAGFLLQGAADNLAVRMRLRTTDFSEVHTTVDLYESYRAMAIANGVDPDDPALELCRGNQQVEYLPHGEA